MQRRHDWPEADSHYCNGATVNDRAVYEYQCSSNYGSLGTRCWCDQPDLPHNSLITISNPVSQRLVSTQATEVSFCISGDIPQSACFTATDLAQLPRTTLTVSDRDGTCIAYEGVLLREILQRAGIPQGEQLRGSNLARYLVVEGADGYEVVFGLPEFDPNWRFNFA